jgi:ligand-binding sensor domain-containing protein
MPHKRIVFIFLILLTWTNAVQSYGRFVNYTATISVYDFACDNDVLWVASSGGLYRYQSANGAGTLYTDPAQFPDPEIMSLCLDGNRTLWMGSRNGYLYKRTINGRQTVAPSYFTADWSLTDIVLYGRYLIIGADKGCSVYDTATLTAFKNATAFGPAFSNSQVNAVAVFRDTLLLGLEQGVAKLYIGGGRLQKENFYDQSIWTADTGNRFQVKSFVVRQDGYLALPTPGAMFRGKMLTTNIPVKDDTLAYVFADSDTITAFQSRVTAIATDGAGRCFIGTKYNYFYLWNGSDTTRVTIDGPTFTSAQRVYVDREGLTWALCPQIMPGISVFRNGRWSLYNSDKYSSMGWKISGTNDFRAIAEDHAGRMWFGTNGWNLKMFDRKNDSSWSQYCIGCKYYGQGQFYRASELWSCYSWAKCDAIAMDSTGFMWIASADNYAGTLICYDPHFDPPAWPVDTSLPSSVKHYRYFFPPEDAAHSMNIGCICVDAAKNIIIGEGFEGNGKIHMLRHQGNPLELGFSVVTELPASYGIVYDAAATRDTLTYIATSNGFYTFDPVRGMVGEGLWVRDLWSSVLRDTLIDSTIKGGRTVEMEDDHIMWIGTADSGLIRYDLSTRSKIIVNETHGLLSNRIWDLSFDHKNGYLWIASERGVSRYSLGYSVGGQNTAPALVYPNPFSKRRHVELIFEKLPLSSKVLIYTVSGTLVAAVSPEENNTHGSACVWKPPASIAPGIYLYSIKSSVKNSRGKIIITP